MRSPPLLVCALSLVALPGCLVNTHRSTSITGRDVSPTTLQQIEPGRTRQDFVLATLGAPTSKSTLDDGTEVWKYEYRKKTQSSGTVFLLLNAGNYTEKDGAVYILLKDGVVQKTWRD